MSIKSVEIEFIDDEDERDKWFSDNNIMEISWKVQFKLLEMFAEALDPLGIDMVFYEDHGSSDYNIKFEKKKQ